MLDHLLMNSYIANSTLILLFLWIFNNICYSTLIEDTNKKANHDNNTKDIPTMKNEPIMIPSSDKHTSSVIFLHGMGDTGYGWSLEMKKVRQLCMKIICPTADDIPISLHLGVKMPAWFDKRDLHRHMDVDTEGLARATAYVQSLIDDEIQLGIAPNKIFVGGFSQGGAVALHAALKYPRRLAGIVVLSTWLPLYKTFYNESLFSANKNIPILQFHGDEDATVTYNFGQQCANTLRNVSDNTKFKTLQGVGHSVTHEEMRNVKEFFKKILRPATYAGYSGRI